MDAKDTYKHHAVDDGCGWRIRQAFGANVRRIRRQQGLTKDTLARMSGMSRQLIGRIEDGSADVRLSFVQRLADALCIPPVELLDETGDWDA